jgi:hypothetical protein
MVLILKESDKTFEDYNEKQMLLSALVNRHMFLEFRDMPEVEANAEIARLRGLLEEMAR